MSQPDSNDDESEGPGFFRRFWLVLLVGGGALLAAGVVMFQLATHKTRPPTREEVITMISLPPPPPPPLPPPPQVQEEKMMEQTPVEDEPKPADAPPPPDPGVTTTVQGSGGPDFGLRQAGGGDTTLGGPARPRSPFGWYAAEVQATISEKFRKNPATRNGSFQIQASVWPDLSGRITRAQLAGSTGDPGVDQVIKQDILMGLQLQHPPPADMPLPIVMRFTARRPN